MFKTRINVLVKMCDIKKKKKRDTWGWCDFVAKWHTEAY